MASTLSPDAHITGRHDLVFLRKDIGCLENDTTDGVRERQSKGMPEAKWKLKRGMIVAFWAPHNPNQMSIKRVIAFEGDTIKPSRWPHAVKDGDKDEESRSRERRRRPARGHVNQEALMEKAEARARRYERAPPVPVVVPFGHVWVEGDNTEDTRDSNDFGPLSKSMIVGVADRVVYPRTRAGKGNWEDDGWESRVGDRVKRRPQEVIEVPEEWAFY